MFDYKMVSKAVLYVHLILCAYFVIFADKLDLPKPQQQYFVIFAAGSAVVGGILTLFNVGKLKFISKFSVPVMLMTLVTWYGYTSNRLNVIAILILAISCISSLYADLKITGLIIVYSFLLYGGVFIFNKELYASHIDESEIFINLFSLFIGQLMIVILLIFCKNALTSSKNKTIQVQELLVEVEDKKNEAERADQAKSDFLANMSHEIRTPMNAITGMVELLMQNELSDKEYEYVSTIKSAANGLLSLINDILDFSKIEAGRLDVIDVDYNPGELINDIVNLINTKIDKEQVSFNVNINPNLPSELYGDELRVKQIALNILSNAAKFTKQGFIIFNINFQPTSQNEMILTLEITDSGIGIKEEDLDEIFDEFKQVDTRRNRNIQGTGLGLAICKRLAHLMGGSVVMDSKYGIGTKVTVTLRQSVKSKVPCAVVNNPRAVSVLIFDVDHYALSSMSGLLTALNIKHDTTDDFEEFKVLLNCRNYTHTFFDYDIGYTFIKKFAKENPRVKCIAMMCRNDYNIADPSDIVATVQKPLHFLSIVPILNGENPSLSKKAQNEYTFIAPTARILIVDDNFVNLKVAEGLLEKFKINVTSATGGFEAIDLIMKYQNYDLVLMDHMMPQIDGVDTVKLIRSSNSVYCRKVPIVAFSANAVKEAQLMFLNNGFNDFLAKPIEVKALKQLLMKWIPKEKLEKASSEVSKMQNGTPSNKTGGEMSSNTSSFDLKLIDTQVGLASCMNDKNAYNEILLIFAKSGHKNINLIINSSKMGSIKDFTTYVHSVKSSAKSIGAMTLSESSYRLEIAGKNNDWQFINQNLKSYIDLYEQVINDIMTNLSPLGMSAPVQKKNISGNMFKNYLMSISQAVNNYDSENALKILKELNNCNLPDAFSIKIEECLQAMEDYDYDKASAIVNNILRYI